MAWTSPMTFASGSVLTAAQLNTHLRDNLMETETGKATTSGGYFVATARNRIAERNAVTARVSTSETTTFTGFNDLTTSGPEVTVETGTTVLLFIGAMASNNTDDRGCVVGVNIAGATSRDAGDVFVQINFDGVTAGNSLKWSNSGYISDLTPGENTFTMKYSVGAGTGTFSNRFICVMPL